MLVLSIALLVLGREQCLSKVVQAARGHLKCALNIFTESAEVSCITKACQAELACETSEKMDRAWTGKAHGTVGQGFLWLLEYHKQSGESGMAGKCTCLQWAAAGLQPAALSIHRCVTAKQAGIVSVLPSCSWVPSAVR